MSRAVASVVLQHQFGSTVRKAVALVLADHADGDRWATIVGQQRISREAEVGDRTVRRVLSEFEEEGIITRTRRHRANGSRSSDEIVLVRSVIENLPATDAGRDKAPTGHSGQKDGENLPATLAEPTGHSDRTYRPQEPGIEPSVEPSVEPPSLRSGTLPATDAGRSDPLFEAIVWVSFGVEWEPGETRITTRERGMANKARKELADVGATPDEVIRRARHFFAWVGQRPTPDNLVTHWNRLNEPQQRATKDQIDAIDQRRQWAIDEARARELDAERRGLGDGR